MINRVPVGPLALSERSESQGGPVGPFDDLAGQSPAAIGY